MQQPVGEIGRLIRQVRRLHNLTQTELGGERFSKSYVSAVEHNKIAPSLDALHYFAEQLGYPRDYFVLALQPAEVSRQLSASDAPYLLATDERRLQTDNGHGPQNDTLALLDKLLEQTAFARSSACHELPALAPEVIAALPQHVQARYYFLLGQCAREQQNLPASLEAFDSALAVSSPGQQAAILDQIGSVYFSQRRYLTALGYYLHALHSLPGAAGANSSVPSRFQIALHCGNAYRALGAYQQALAQYEQAHRYLNAEHDLHAAASLCEGLGYSIYAAIFPLTAPAVPTVKDPPPEEIERAFQRATSFLLQSRSIYQVSGDRLQEARVRLALAFIQLDLSIWRRRQARQKTSSRGKPASASSTALLNEAEEQCRQVLLGWQNPPGDDTEASLTRSGAIIYAALACLIRISVQRAILARQEGGHVDTAYRERSLAGHLCQQVLSALAEDSPPWTLIRQVVDRSFERLAYNAPSLPQLIDLPIERGKSAARDLLSLVEVYFAAGEMAEELGRVATMHDYAHDCYSRANRYFQAALSTAHEIIQAGEQDPGYLVRLYQRCITLLEERLLASPALAETTTSTLLTILKIGFGQLRSPFPAETEHP